MRKTHATPDSACSVSGDAANYLTVQRCISHAHDVSPVASQWLLHRAARATLVVDGYLPNLHQRVVAARRESVIVALAAGRLSGLCKITILQLKFLTNQVFFFLILVYTSYQWQSTGRAEVAALDAEVVGLLRDNKGTLRVAGMCVEHSIISLVAGSDEVTRVRRKCNCSYGIRVTLENPVSHIF